MPARGVLELTVTSGLGGYLGAAEAGDAGAGAGAETEARSAADASFRKLLALIRAPLATPEERLRRLALACAAGPAPGADEGKEAVKVASFTPRQGAEVLSALEHGDARVDALVRCVLPRTTAEHANAPLRVSLNALLATVTAKEQDAFFARLGLANARFTAPFRADNPTGRYELDLGLARDRLVCCELFRLASDREAFPLPDRNDGNGGGSKGSKGGGGAFKADANAPRPFILPHAFWRDVRYDPDEKAAPPKSAPPATPYAPSGPLRGAWGRGSNAAVPKRGVLAFDFVAPFVDRRNALGDWTDWNERITGSALEALIDGMRAARAGARGGYPVGGRTRATRRPRSRRARGEDAPCDQAARIVAAATSASTAATSRWRCGA